jgi:hypothetical protein
MYQRFVSYNDLAFDDPNHRLETHGVGHTGQRELGGKLDDVLLQGGQLLRSLSVSRVGGDKVLQQLGPGLLLSLKRDLNGSVQKVGDNVHVLLGHRSAGQGGQTDSDTTGDLGRSVTRDGVLVDGDVALVADLLDLGSGQAEGSEVPEDQVVVGTVSLELVVMAREDLGDGSGVGDDLLGVRLESGVSGLLQGDGDTGDGLRQEKYHDYQHLLMKFDLHHFTPRLTLL